jgi:hypothetical protein
MMTVVVDLLIFLAVMGAVGAGLFGIGWLAVRIFRGLIYGPAIRMEKRRRYAVRYWDQREAAGRR